MQGFVAPAWVDAAGDSLGSLQMVVDQTSGTVTLILPKSAFGTVGAGWVFTVALTGQDGFSTDQARAFAGHASGRSRSGSVQSGKTQPDLQRRSRAPCPR